MVEPAGTGLVYDDRYLAHEPGGFHPERPARLEVVLRDLRDAGILERLVRIAPRPAEIASLETVHAPDYVRLVREVCARGAPSLPTGDTDICPATYEVARLAAGAGPAALDAIAEGRIRNAFCAVRPPGHHATRDQGMGFCVFNNAAVAARYGQARHGWRRVLVVDWDVHHGNGTQAIVDADPDIFYFSTHRFPFYPGTGRREEDGRGEGKGTVRNVPLGGGADREAYLRAFREELAPAADRFRPDLVLVSAGFDAHRHDPLGGGPGGMRLEAGDFGDLARVVRGIAERYAGGRLVALLEGGYDLDALAASAAEVVRVLLEPAGPPDASRSAGVA